MIIPVSPEFDVPGADDPAIQTDILTTTWRDAGLVREALDFFAHLAGRPLASLDPARREAVAMEFRETGGAGPTGPRLTLGRSFYYLLTGTRELPYELTRQIRLWLTSSYRGRLSPQYL